MRREVEVGKRPVNPISISVAPLNRMTGRMYYDLANTIKIMRRLLDAGVAAGFEIQNLAEWDARTPPRDEGERRLVAWKASERHTVAQLAATLTESGLPVLSIHANRDVGVCLCSGQPEDIARGRQLIHESLWLAEQVSAGVCVFHLWDTWKETFDPAIPQNAIREIAAQFPTVKAAIENGPTHLTGHTPFDLVLAYDWITLDLRWAALYDQFHEFATLKDRIANVHLSGQLANGQWTANPKWFVNSQNIIDFDAALDILVHQWHYTGPLTVEICNAHQGAWDDLIAAMKTIVKRET